MNICLTCTQVQGTGRDSNLGPTRRQAGAKNVAIRLIPLSYALLNMKSEFAMLVFIKLESGTSYWILDKKRKKISFYNESNVFLTTKVMFP